MLQSEARVSVASADILGLKLLLNLENVPWSEKAKKQPDDT